MPTRLPKSTWDSIKSLYISGTPLRQIAKQTGVKLGTIVSRSSREKWTRARQETETLKAQVVPFNPDAEMVAITAANARETRRYLSEWLMKAAKSLAETGDFPVPRTVEEAKCLESIRASLFPAPAVIDHRAVHVNVDVSKGLSDETLSRIESLAKLM